jgi:uncharacterized protein YndB with AHSA1/START domain
MSHDELTLRFVKEFSAPPELLFDIETNVNHVQHTIAPFGERVDVCEIDLRIGGAYHFVFTPEGGEPCSFRGEFLELEHPSRISATWIFDGWPGVTAVETKHFERTASGARMTYELTFADAEGRSRMRDDGLAANFDNVERYIATLSAADKESDQ